MYSAFKCCDYNERKMKWKSRRKRYNEEGESGEEKLKEK